MTAHSNTAQHKKSISWGKWLLSLVLVLLGAVFAAYWLLPVDRILEDRLKLWLSSQGVQAEFHISTLSGTRSVVEDIGLADSDAIRIGRVEATYTLAGLREKHIDTLTVSGLRLTVTETAEDKAQVEGLDWRAASGDDADTEPLALPFNRLTVEDAQLTYQPLAGAPIVLRGDLTLNADYTGALHIAEFTLPLEKPEQGEILLTGLSVRRDAPDAPFALALDSIAHVTGGKAWFTPLKATGSITRARDGQELGGIMTITDLRGLWAVNAKGEADLDAGTWNINFEQPPMTFETGILQPDMLFPVLRGSVGQTSGAISLRGSVSQPAEGAMTSEGELVLQDAGMVVKDIPVNKVNGTLAFSSLWPPSTKGRQSLTVGEILLGLPLSNGKLHFTLAKDGTTRFDPSTWDWAGGQLQTGGASLNLYKPALPDITLSARGIALEHLLSGLLQKGVSATGRLSGTIPVRFTVQREAMIEGGRLATEGGGVVRYTPDTESPLQKGSSIQTDILLSAMENFHYDELDMTINSKSEHELEVVLHVKGRNPELYNGQMIELNINLTGNLLDIVQSGMDVYTLPERLQEQLTQ